MVADKYIDIDEIRRQSGETPEVSMNLVRYDENRNVVGFKNSSYRTLSKDSAFFPKELLNAQNECFTGLISLETALFSEEYKNNKSKFQDAVVEVLSPYCEQLNNFYNDFFNETTSQHKEYLSEVLELRSRYAAEDDDFCSEEERLAEKYRLNNLEDTCVLPQSLQGNEYIEDFFTLSEKLGTNRLVSGLLLSIGKRADKFISVKD